MWVKKGQYAVQRVLGVVRREDGKFHLLLEYRDQSTESPIFDAPFWSENWISCPHERHKIGDSVLCLGDRYLEIRLERWLPMVGRQEL